ncbi:uncharacterized protein B0I36DRAFT_429016 [Microdochium trichocladiopsis]|uniref:Uncharacterized protein n=1 Tax=Microdochium trichocladiopsis TaxID=1682393 RepID=A0A9P9BW50_9PEZI|nr:uncharacterized protein B0I36DRAFT_429016 [Microdochium trichocladiopsis]KAH7034726.1 hypothetical protein B0I36DRAFT_429016 [Microdochium trichocladiopsis]
MLASSQLPICLFFYLFGIRRSTLEARHTKPPVVTTHPTSQPEDSVSILESAATKCRRLDHYTESEDVRQNTLQRVSSENSARIDVDNRDHCSCRKPTNSAMLVVGGGNCVCSGGERGGSARKLKLPPMHTALSQRQTDFSPGQMYGVERVETAAND